MVHGYQEQSRAERLDQSSHVTIDMPDTDRIAATKNLTTGRITWIRSLRGAGTVVILLFGAALLVRLYRLGAQSLWLDEGGTWAYITSNSWPAMLLDLIDPQAKAAYPLYHVLLKAWVTIFGESETALRLPSALAGAMSVPLLFMLGRRLAGTMTGFAAALLMLASPFAIWQAQDAKAYSLFILCAIAALLLTWEALQRGGRERWWPAVAALLICLFVHRLSILLIIGLLVAIQLPGVHRGELPRRAWLRLLLRASTVVLILLTTAGLRWALQRAEGAAAPGRPMPPLQALWQAIKDLPLYRSSQHLWLLLPFVLLFGWGLARLVLDLRRSSTRPAATFVLSVGLLPSVLFLLLLSIAVKQPIYEARYLSGSYPLFLLTLVWPLQTANRLRLQQLAAGLLVALAITSSTVALLQKPAGIFSGEPIKEQYRQAVEYLAKRVHPDDVVIVHPPYIDALYRYYASRVTPDPLPQPVTMGRLGAKGYKLGQFDEELNTLLKGHTRAWLFEAPNHAIKIDPPPKPEDEADKMGRLAINFRYAYENRKWNCADHPWREFLGVRILCQSFPEIYGQGTVPQPEQPHHALFGEDGAIELLGYTLNFFPGTQNRAQAGGSLPVTLFWQSTRHLQNHEDYIVFLHLVRNLGERPVAQEDIRPLEGWMSTGTWIGTPVHDEHAIALPATLEPGRYRLLLGLFDPTKSDNPQTPERVESRLPVKESDGPHGLDYIELGSIEVIRP